MTDTNLIGKRLDEYHILSWLSEDGVSATYLGLDTNLQEYTTIKVIRAPQENDPDYVTRFEQEASSIVALKHPNMAHLYRYGQADDLLYMAMRYIEGVDLATVLQSYREDGHLMPMADAVRIIKEICHALDYAHERGFLHRHVQPVNIMLNREGRAILSGFVPDLQGMEFKTSPYIAPEQAQSPVQVGAQADLYAVGIIFYEMVTGELPASVLENPDELFARGAVSALPTPRSVQPEISTELEAAILKALAFNPTERYPSGKALVAALDPAAPLGQATAVSAAPILASERRAEEQPPPVIMKPYHAAEAPVATAVPTPPPPQAAPNLLATLQQKIAGLDLSVKIVGGLIALMLLAVLAASFIAYGGDGPSGRHQIWLPVIVQEQLSGNDAPPAADGEINASP